MAPRIGERIHAAATRSHKRASTYDEEVTREAEDLNRRLLRARDAIDRAYAGRLDVPAIAAVAHLSPAHFSRCFRAVFGETPHRYLQRRRIERSMFLLRDSGRSVTDICFAVGFTSLGTFSRTFREVVGESPTEYRGGNGPVVVPVCVQMAHTRPRSSSFGEATTGVRAPNLATFPFPSAEEEPR
jgi:AraC-like DNA-binding protein